MIETAPGGQPIPQRVVNFLASHLASIRELDPRVRRQNQDKAEDSLLERDRLEEVKGLQFQIALIIDPIKHGVHDQERFSIEGNVNGHSIKLQGSRENTWALLGSVDYQKTLQEYGQMGGFGGFNDSFFGPLYDSNLWAPAVRRGSVDGQELSWKDASKLIERYYPALRLREARLQAEEVARRLADEQTAQAALVRQKEEAYSPTANLVNALLG